MLKGDKIALLLCLMASSFYAAEIVIADKKLSKISPLVLTLFFGVGIVAFAIPGVVYGVRTGTVQLPQGREWLLIASIAFLTFLADWSHFAALNQRAGGVVLATFYMLIPVFTSVMKGQVPTVKTLIAWVLGGIALLLISSELEE